MGDAALSESVANEFGAGVLRGGEFLSLSDLFARASRAASGLASLGVGPGQSVALVLRNDHEFFEAVTAAIMVGATAVPINWHGSVEEVLYVVRDAGATVLVAHADLLRRLRGHVPEGVTVLGVTTPDSIAAAYQLDADDCVLDGDVLNWVSWRDSFEPFEETREGATMLYTSGTTGNPKGVRRLAPNPDAEAYAAYVADVSRYCGLWPGMRTILAGPLYHSAPLFEATTALTLNGAFIVLQDRFDAEGLLALIERYAIDSLYLVPTQFVRLLRLPEAVRARYDLSSLRAIWHTAAPCPAHVKRGLIEWLGPIISEVYGSTEVGIVTGCTSEEWLSHPGSVGHALDACEIEIRNEEGPVAVGEVGEVFVRATAFSDFTYHERPDARDEVERAGRFTAGDVGYLDDDGFLYLCDRARDMIISGGVNIYPIEIENVLLQLPGVADCAVFGVPDEEYGESVAAAVQVLAGHVVSEADVREFIGSHLARFKVPKVVAFHDELPRQETGKIFKRKLRAPYWEAAGRSI